MPYTYKYYDGSKLLVSQQIESALRDRATEIALLQSVISGPKTKASRSQKATDSVLDILRNLSPDKLQAVKDLMKKEAE